MRQKFQKNFGDKKPGETKIKKRNKIKNRIKTENK